MFSLFRTELLRHRTLALGVAGFHFAVLYYLYTLGASVLRSMQALIWLLACMGLAAGFGIFQMSRYRRDNDWIHLLHRPLRPGRIFQALALAGALMSVFIAVVPLALIIVVMHGNQMFGIEARFYQTIPYAAAAALTAYFCGCFAVLSSSKLGLLALGMLAPFLMVEPDAELLWASVLLLVWATLLALSAFKADLSRPPRRLRTLILAELPIQCGCLLVLTLATGWISGLGQWAYGYDRNLRPLPDSDDFVRAMSPTDAMHYALERSSHPEARLLSQQVALGETMMAGPASFNRHPARGQLPFLDEALIVADGKLPAVWRFRHDVMLYEGRNTDSAAFIGWLAPDGFHDPVDTLPATRFDSVPVATGDRFIVSDADIYQLNWQQRQLYHRYHNDNNDRFNNSLTLGEHVSTLLSDHNLYVFNSAALLDPTATLEPDAVLPVPAAYSPDLRKLSILPLHDSYLISALLDQTPFSNAPDYAALGRARLELYRVPQRGEAELIVQVPLPSGADTWSLYKHFVLAPGIRLFQDFFTGSRLHKDAATTLPLLYVRFPTNVYLGAIVVCLVSAALTAWLLRRSTLPLRIRLFWIVGNGLTGIAGLLSFLIGHYWKRTDLLLAQSPRPAEAIATQTHTPAFQ